MNPPPSLGRTLCVTPAGWCQRPFLHPSVPPPSDRFSPVHGVWLRSAGCTAPHTTSCLNSRSWGAKPRAAAGLKPPLPAIPPTLRPRPYAHILRVAGPTSGGVWPETSTACFNHFAAPTWLFSRSSNHFRPASRILPLASTPNLSYAFFIAPSSAAPSRPPFNNRHRPLRMAG